MMIISTQLKAADFLKMYVRRNNQLTRQGVFGADENITSTVLPDFSIDPKVIFRRKEA